MTFKPILNLVLILHGKKYQKKNYLIINLKKIIYFSKHRTAKSSKELKDYQRNLSKLFLNYGRKNILISYVKMSVFSCIITTKNIQIL